MFDKIVNHLNNCENFSFSRFGDGEWACLTGKHGQNCDAHVYFPELGKRLKEIVESKPSYYMGLQTLASEMYKSQIEDYKGVEWVESDCLHRASIRRRIEPFFEALRKRNIILIGNETHYRLSILPLSKIIEVPSINCWKSYEETKSKILEIVQENDVILYCASMMSNVLIDDVFKAKGNVVTQIDCGSIFEPYIGLATRSYHRDLINKMKYE